MTVHEKVSRAVGEQDHKPSAGQVGHEGKKGAGGVEATTGGDRQTGLMTCRRQLITRAERRDETDRPRDVM